MSNFTGPINLTVSGREFELIDDLVYADQDVRYTVAAGTKTDLASVPWLFRWLIPAVDERYAKAACLHDWAYRTHPPGMTKLTADRLFLVAMLEDRTKIWRAYVMYRGVRWFGGRAWRGGPARALQEA